MEFRGAPRNSQILLESTIPCYKSPQKYLSPYIYIYIYNIWLPPPPLVVAGGTVTGTILAFVGGWFKFKLGYLNVKLILKILSDLEPLIGSSNKKTLYSTRSCVNWTFFGTGGPLKRSFHSRFKLAHSCQKRPNLHTNSLNKLVFSLFFLIL
jgi:hypothetical protein